MNRHPTGTRQQWRRSRLALLELEKEHTRRSDELARLRNQREVTMVCVSRAQLDRIDAYKRRMGWSFPWVSSLDSDFNFDFGVSFTEDQQANGAEYNFRWEADPGDEGHGLSSFALEDGAVYHVCEWWWRRHDEYEDGQERT
jgi:predicted dithiol-disulfide oxidoreductase (DUF899 family)